MWPAGCGPEDYVTPECANLPTSWNWSLYFCQSLLESAAAQVELLETDRVEDRTWTGRVAGDRVVHAQYVDNFFACGTDVGAVQSAFDRMRQVLEDWGFSIHEVTEAQPVVHGLGLIIDGSRKRISLTPARIWKLRLAALALGRRRVPPPVKVVEKVVGHFTFAMMVRRECLSVFNAVYMYVRLDKPSGSLWRAAHHEILQASSILPMICASLDLPWSPTVIATDSSEVGYGVCERQLESIEVACVGRSCEHWRYSVEGAIKARAHAFGEDTEQLDPGDHYECARVRDADFKEVVLCLVEPVIFFAAADTLDNVTCSWLTTLLWLLLAPRATQSFMYGGFPLSEIVLIVPLGAPSLLEAVRRTSTQDRYNAVVDAFLFWCRGHFSLSTNYDALLTAYLNELYSQGADLSAAEYAFAAFRYRFPEYGKHGSKMLARATQALEPKMRLPTPRVAFAAIVGALLAHGHAEMALGLSSNGISFCGPASSQAFAHTRWFEPPCLRGCPSGATLYGNRHGGVSELRLLGTPLKEIKARGRWMTDTSLKRYEKATVAQQQVRKVPFGTQLYGNFVEQQLPRCSQLLREAVTGNATAKTQLAQSFRPLPSV
ncbi:unnamed protein product [Symbiodinium pilosum]|uniref:Uncharacterized protein n=1 Tax=Symbiodinium pilosum TaxID=2952 RepID=A0A812Q094_SYMPI|nr:unnamed protein product [Symbiodinium pilosum]